MVAYGGMDECFLNFCAYQIQLVKDLVICVIEKILIFATVISPKIYSWLRVSSELTHFI